MGLLLLRSLTILMCFSWLPDLGAQSGNGSLDSLLQEYSFRGFGTRPKTGTPYDGHIPSNMIGIEVAALRLRSGSLRRKGYAKYREFSIPEGVTVTPYVERLVLVYQNLGNWSEFYYPLTGYSYLAPVVGLLAYDAQNLSATGLPELDIRASEDPISISFSNVRPEPDRFSAKCVRFGPKGLINFSSMSSGNVCVTTQPGHFSIVAESKAPSPLPVTPTAPPPPMPSPPSPDKKKKNESKTRAWIIAGSVVGGVIVLGLLSLLALCGHKYKQRKEMKRIEMAAEAGEPLNMVSVGDTRAPAATVTRTQPVLENEYMM
ncbi:PREDICTED: uncharacterized protein LOC104806250 [Tarenaya hassleriana]|uniref:uncharacterized protein LOC104806250 n=1 Tax=Tarenaya hassleriana TaxID=28532 RepID=UPI00053C38F3|nr:PREDICTED: uncharacterized protein LOC104806250 [Tarenaya hassleriana]